MSIVAPQITMFNLLWQFHVAKMFLLLSLQEETTNITETIMELLS